jgi:hypothetical protein
MAYRTYKPRPPSAEQIAYQIARSKSFVARMEAEGRTAAAEYEREHLARLRAALAVAESREPMQAVG